MTILLSRQDVQQILSMPDTIDILEAAFADLANGDALMPQRTPIVVPEHTGLALFMPAFLKGVGALGAKTVTVYKNNPAKYQLPTIMGTILILDQTTGAPLSIMDGGFLTGMRTGAVAGLATRYMARKDASVATVIGSGGMATAQALALAAAKPLTRMIVASLDTREQREAFAATLTEKTGVPCETMDSVEEAVRAADIVTLITSAKDPIVKWEWFKKGAHINGVGSHAPRMRELDSDTVVNSRIVCDLIDACMAEAGDFLIPEEEGVWSRDQLHASLGDVVIGKAKGRLSDDEVTLFKSVGLAIQDISAAYHVYTKAKEQGLGTEFSF